MNYFSVLAGALATAALLIPGHAALADDSQTHGVTDSEIVLGMLADLSGPAASSGVAAANGVRMRVDEANDAGGIFGRKIRLIIEDTQYQVPRAAQAINKLLNRDHVFAMVGAHGTSTTLVGFPQQFAANVPNLFPVAQARSLSEPVERLKFAYLTSYYAQIRAGIKYFVENRKKKTICVMYQENDFGKEVLLGAQDEAKALNMEITEAVSHPPAATDFTSEIIKLKAANCDFVVLGTLVRDSIIGYQTARRMGWDVDFLGSTGTYDQSVADAKDGATEGIYAMSAREITETGGNAPPAIQEWNDRYKAKFGVDPNYSAQSGYVSMDLTVIGLQNAGKDLTVDSLIKGIEAIHGYQDIFGEAPVSFGPGVRMGANGASTFIAQVKNGKWTRVTDRIGY